MKANLFVLTLLAGIAAAQQPAAPQLREPSGQPPAASPAKAPEPIKPASVAPAGKPKDAPKPTTIDCDNADLNLKESIFTYNNNVVVDGDQFHLTTDGTFTVYMKKDKDKKPKEGDKSKGGDAAKGTSPAKGPDAAKAPPAKAENKSPVAAQAAAGKALSDEPSDESDLDHATAVGREVVIIKHDAEGKTKIGRCRNAYYDGKTGDMILRDWPQVQDGDNVIIAAEASCVMTLTKDGKFHVKGRTRSEIVRGAAPQPGAKAQPAAGAPNGGGGISIPVPAPRRQQ